MRTPLRVPAPIMPLRLYNTLTRSVEIFEPLDPAGKQVSMYCCGPTVYDYAHIGNWRTFVFSDLVRRTLEFEGFAVTHVMNITDVDDKIIRKVRETGQSLEEFTTFFERAFVEDLSALNCMMPHHSPHATAHIPQIISLVAQLVGCGLAYTASDGSVYFSISKYQAAGRRYGQLVKLNLDELKVGERVRSDDYDKESVADFALWKARVPEDGEVFWPSPWGEGRPGWHIECSAMSMSLLGPCLDLHLGGEDLVFPHHEDEIAQSEGVRHNGGGRFVKYWLHGAHLLVEGKKMSKSLGNFFTLRDLQAKAFTAREVRYLLLSAHYRETFNFTLEGLNASRAALLRIDECISKLQELSAGAQAPPDEELVRDFSVALRDDLNVSAAWGAVFEWIRNTNRKIAESGMPTQAAASALAGWDRIDTVLGIGRPKAAEAPGEVLRLMEERQTARRGRDFKRADAIRGELKALGWTIEDTPKGPKPRKL